MLSLVSFERGLETAPAVFPDQRGREEPSSSFRGSVTSGGAGREKHQPDPNWTSRIISLGGLDITGRPLFRAAWGWDETRREGCTLRYPHVVNQWLLLRRFPASAWGTRRQWYEPRIEAGQWVASFAESFGEDYPTEGAEEIWYAFPRGVPFNMPYIEYRLIQFANREQLPSRAERMRRDRAVLEEADQRQWQADYERFTAATRPSLGEPWVGYGRKLAAVKSDVPVMPPQVHEKIKQDYARRRMARLRKRATG